MGTAIMVVVVSTAVVYICSRMKKDGALDKIKDKIKDLMGKK